MEIKDYLHLYLGCTVEIPDNHVGKHELIKSTRKGTFLGFADYHRLECRIGFRGGPEGRVGTFFIKPILRPLSDITAAEASEVCKLVNWREDGSMEQITKYGVEGIQMTVNNQAEFFKSLLSKHFDLFGLIEAGLAVDATTLLNKDQGVQE
jgi:hypothetical protein